MPTDTLFERQWHLNSVADAELAANAHVSATDAWDVTRGSRDVVVAVVDDGFDLNHPDFVGAGKVVSPKDYVDGDASPFPETAEDDYHGTPCAGVAIAEENGQGVVGVAPGCAFMPVRLPLSADDNEMWDIFDFFGRWADVFSCSWGPPPVFVPLSQLLDDKFADLAATGGPRKKGCVICFAAGNDNAPLNDPNNTGFLWRHPDYGILNTTGPILSGNAAHPGVIAVAAVSSLNRKTAYSSWGAEFSVSAPSNNFHPLDRNAQVPGRGIWTTDNEGRGSGFTPGSRFTGRFGGTSSATPLVAGVAALVISANPELTATEVRRILEQTADKITVSQPDIVLGNTKGTYDGNGHSEWFGFGRVNANAAVREARSRFAAATGVSDLPMQALGSGALAASGDTQSFKVTVGRNLTVTLDGPEGQDFDVYLRRGAQPTTERYDARGYTSSADEQITFNVAEPDDYFVMVRSYRGSGNFDVSIRLD